LEDRHVWHLRVLDERLRRAPGSLSLELRAAVIDAAPVDDSLVQSYVETIRRHAYKVTDRRVEDLKRAGWSEEQIFELSVAASYGAARRCLDFGVRALHEAVSTQATADPLQDPTPKPPVVPER
jgi:hypothetical protein